MNRPLISIVIPVYKVEKYLQQCLDSVLVHQDINRLEVICINDGSPDNSRAILTQYEKKYDNIRVIDKVNAGLPAARNTGLEYVTGDYIYFLDSDDFLLSNVLRRMYDFVVNYNLDIGCFNVLKDGSDPYYNIKKNLPVPLQGMEYYIENFKINGFFPPSAVWTMLFRKEFLKENNLKFKEGIEHEDEQFTPRAFYFASSVGCLDIPIQHHRMLRPGSVTESTLVFFDESNNRDLIETCNDLYVFFLDKNHISPLILKKIFNNYLSVAKNLSKKAPSKKNHIFFDDDFMRMKACVTCWEHFAYYWLFRYTTPAFSWYVSDKGPQAFKKGLNRLFKIYYQRLRTV